MNAATKKQRPYEHGEERAFKGVSIRIEADVEQRLDAIAKKLARPGEKITRATAARMAFFQGLAAFEKQLP